MKTTAPMKTVRLTKRQAEEIEHKLYVLADSEELLEDYSLSKDEVSDLARSLHPILKRGGDWSFNDRFLSMIREEMENAADIAWSNHRFPEWGGQRKSMDNLTQKLSRP